MKIQIIFCDKEPLTEANKWDYPIEEIGYIFEQISDGTMEDNCTMLYYKERLYEV